MNVFDLQAKISLDTKGYESDLKSAGHDFSKFADGLKSAAGMVGDVLAGIGKAAVVGIGAAGTALTALTKQSLDAVANYEQLVGGVDKIFGESSKKVQQYANEAYQTAGLSANAYMETVTGFSASLIQGLKGDTEQAAEIANMAVKDMADNANTYGTDIAQIQSNYQALAKQNYTLLDNLKLGYGGTKAEMARLLNDANKINNTILGEGVEVDDKFEDVTFDQMIRAIHTIQEELKITGTTSKEASGTITGSVASMKAAWENFLTGTGTPEQFTKILSTSIENIRKNLNKIIPRLTEGLTELVDLLAPEIPPIIEETLPVIIEGSSTLLTALAERLPELIKAILPSLAEGVIDVSTALVEVMPELITSLKDSIPIVVQTIMEKKDDLLKAGKDIIKALFPEKIDTQQISDITKIATSVVGQLAISVTNPENVKKVVAVGDQIIGSLIDGLLSQQSIQAFIDNAPQIIENLVEGIKTVLLGSEQDGEGGIFGAAKEIVIRLGEYFSDPQNRKNFLDAAINIVTALGEGLVSILQNGVAPLMVEVARAWAQTFIGEIDYNDTATEILERLAKAFVHNLTHFGLLGEILSRQTDREDYLALDPDLFSGTMSDYDSLTEDQQYDLKLKQMERDAAQYQNNYVSVPEDRKGSEYSQYQKELANSNVPDFVKEQMRKHAKGFYASKPSVMSADIVGEDGDEVLLPLEKNTEWMDKFAAKLDRLLMSDDLAATYQTINNDNATTNIVNNSYESPMLGRITQIIDSFGEKVKSDGDYASFRTNLDAEKPDWIMNEPEMPDFTAIEKLTDRLDTIGGNITITGDIIIQAPSSDAEDIADSFIAAIDEKLRNRQMAQDRSTGGTGWK